VAAQRADDQTAAIDGLLERLQTPVARQQRGRVGQRVARIGPGPDFEGPEAQVDDVVQRFFERLLSKQDGEHSDFHRTPFTRTQRRDNEAHCTGN
jgi:hypothetical protein